MSWHGRLGFDGKGWLGSRGEDRLGPNWSPVLDSSLSSPVIVDSGADAGVLEVARSFRVLTFAS